MPQKSRVQPPPPKSVEVVRQDRDILMGPPRLLSSIEAQEQPDQESPQPPLPRTIMVQKSAGSLGVIQLWLKAGSLNESSEERGGTSLLRSLILGERDQPESVISQLTRRGAQVRDWSTLNRYVIEIKTTSEQVKETLKLLGSSLRRSLSKQEVQQAIKLRLQSEIGGHDPAQVGWLRRRVMLRLLAQVFNDSTSGPQRFILSGEESLEQIKRLSYRSVKRFYERITHPQDNTVVIIGSISEAEVNQTMQTYWSLSQEPQLTSFEDEVEIARREKAQGVDELNALDDRSMEPKLPLSIEEIDAKSSLISIAFPISGLTPEEASYLDILSLILIGDHQGLLHRACERVGVELQYIGVTPVIHRERSALIVSAQVNNLQVNEAWGAILGVIAQIARQPISQQILEEAKSKLERETLLVSEPLSGQALRLGFFSSQWSQGDALQRYGRAAYRAQVKSLFPFTRQVFLNPDARALIASSPPRDLNVKIWREQLAEQLKLEMSEHSKPSMKGFSAHEAGFHLFFSPLKSEGVSSLYAMIPLPRSHRSAASLALGHWTAAKLSQQSPRGARFIARFHDESITLSATFPSSHIDAAVSGLIKALRQAPISSEMSWSSDTLERARRKALTRLSISERLTEENALLLDRRVRSAFGSGALPLFPRRRQSLTSASSSKLMSWFRQNVQSQPVYVVVSGDVSERRLRQAFSPLMRSGVSPPARELHKRPIASPSTSLKACRELQMSQDQPRGMIMTSYPTPSDLSLEVTRLLEVALTSQALEDEVPHAIKMRVIRSPVNALNTTVSIQVSALGSELKRGQESLKARIKRLQTGLLTPKQLKRLRDLTLSIEMREVEVSARYAEWLTHSWLMGWQSEGSRGFKEWSAGLDEVTPIQLRDAALKLFKPERRRVVMIAQPQYHQALSEGCQRVAP